MDNFLKKSGHYFLTLGLILNLNAIPWFGFSLFADTVREIAQFENIIAMTSLIQNQAASSGQDERLRHYNVPFFSQFSDIYTTDWQKKGCGVAALAMLINFHKPSATSAMQLLQEGINAGAYQINAGWKHKALAELAEEYGLRGKSYDFAKLDDLTAFEEFKKHLKAGPMIVSIHNKFDPRATLGHLVVATGFENGFIFYNDPAGTPGEKKILIEDFLAGWKRRFITVN